MSRSFVRRCSLATVLVATASISAQQPRRVFTPADYDRAVRMLGQSLNGLVIGGAAQATWLPDGRFWYRSVTPTDSSMAWSLMSSIYHRVDQPPHTVTSREALNE